MLKRCIKNSPIFKRDKISTVRLLENHQGLHHLSIILIALFHFGLFIPTIIFAISFDDNDCKNRARLTDSSEKYHM